jgi:hypothetical protein
MGAALDLVHSCINNDIKKNTPTEKGDYKPIVFILTDGQPTDSWEGPAQRLKAAKPGVANIYAIGCGDEVDFSVMDKIADTCIYMKELSPAGLNDLFVWLSASIQFQSVSASPDSPVNLEKVPLKKDMILVDSSNLPAFTSRPRLYIHAICSNTNKYYLCCFKYEPLLDKYRPLEPVQLPDGFFDHGSKKAEPVNTSMLLAFPDCPWCGNHCFTSCCSCGAAFCLDPDAKVITCPSCKVQLAVSRGGGGDFNISGSQG